MENKLNDKIRACLVGYALGDTLGKGTEFMSKDVVHLRYPNGLRTFGGIVRDVHRSQWKPNEWTNDTEVVLRMAETMADTGDLTVGSQADMLKDWFQTHDMDVVPIMRRVLSQEDYIDDPMQVAQRIWDAAPGIDASNEALGRALLAGLWPDENYAERVRDIIRLSHSHALCLVTGQIVAAVAHDLLWHDTEPSFQRLANICGDLSSRVHPYLIQARDGNLADFCLDDPDTLSYTRKAMGCALYALWHCSTMQEALYKIVDEGGDADTNAALALGLMGLKYGTAALPEYLTDELLDRERVEKAADRLSDLLMRQSQD